MPFLGGTSQTETLWDRIGENDFFRGIEKQEGGASIKCSTVAHCTLTFLASRVTFSILLCLMPDNITCQSGKSPGERVKY